MTIYLSEVLNRLIALRYHSLAFVVLLSCWLPAATTYASQQPLLHAGTCVRVVDGDSLYIEGQSTQIRLWGVDAPERAQPGFSEATATLKRLALDKRLVCRQVDIDKYQRIIGHCFLQTGEDINRLMLQSGTASEYCYFSRGFFGFCDKRQ